MISKLLSLFFFISAVAFSICSCKKNKVEPETKELTTPTDKPITSHLSYGNNCNQYLRTLENVKLNHLSKTNDDGYVFCGRAFDSEGNYHIYILKTNCFGEKEWESRVKSQFNSEATHIIPASNESYILYTKNQVNSISSFYNLGVIKINKNGDKVWTIDYDNSSNSYFRNVHLSDDGLAAVALISNSSTVSETIVKIDFDSNELFQKKLLGNARYHHLSSNSDGTFFAVGERNNKTMLMKLSAQGDSLWTKEMSVGGDNSGFHIQSISNSDIIVTGITENTQSNLNRTIFISRINSSGTTIWVKIYDDNQFIDFKDVGLSADENLLINVAENEMDSISSQLLKVDLTNGSKLWQRNIGLILGNTLVGTDDNGVFYLGNVGNLTKSLMRKTDANGY
ncbi:MAG: hypothetical protein AB8B74_13725 [Crocinitomicaceae bacterium]